MGLKRDYFQTGDIVSFSKNGRKFTGRMLLDHRPVKEPNIRYWAGTEYRIVNIPFDQLSKATRYDIDEFMRAAREYNRVYAEG